MEHGNLKAVIRQTLREVAKEEGVLERRKGPPLVRAVPDPPLAALVEIDEKRGASAPFWWLATIPVEELLALRRLARQVYSLAPDEDDLIVTAMRSLEDDRRTG